MDEACLTTFHDAADNKDPISVIMIITEQLTLNLRNNENLESKESKFRKWVFEIFCSIMVINECGIDGLKVYLNDTGICNANISGDCLDATCPSMHEPR